MVTLYLPYIKNCQSSMNYQAKFSTLDRKIVLLIGAGIIVIISVTSLLWGTWQVFFVALLVVVFIILFNNPEIAAAIQFNGIPLYFYLLDKIGVETTTNMTIAFYVFMAGAYLTGGYYLKIQSGILPIINVDRIFGLLFIMFYLSYIFFSLDNPNAYRKVTLAPFVVIAPYVGIQLFGSLEQVDKFFKCCALLTLVMVLPSFYELYYNPMYEEYGRFSLYHFEEKGNNPIQYGISFALLLIMMIVRFRWPKKRYVLYTSITLVALYLLVRSGARGPFISFLLALSIYLIWLSKIKGKYNLFIFVSLLSVMVTIFMFIPDATSVFYQVLLDPTYMQFQDPSIDSIQGRIILMKEAMNEFIKYPFIGVGTGNSSGGTGYPHNSVLEAAAEYGILGLLLFLMFILVAIRSGYKMIKISISPLHERIAHLTYILFIFAFTESLFSGYMGGDMLLYGSISLLSVVYKLKQNEERAFQRNQYVLMKASFENI